MDTEGLKKPEVMAEFFNNRAEGYDDHMRGFFAESFEQFYNSLSSCIAKTESKVRILDIGCGTGLELRWILERTPNATLTAIDISSEMLDRLARKFKDRLHQVTLVKESYLTLPLSQNCYDYVVAVMTLHHLLPQPKLELYGRVVDSLKPHGTYIEGDYVVNKQKEHELLSAYEQTAKTYGALMDGSHHIDIPCSIETQKSLLRQAGFSKVDIIWKQGEAAVYTGRV